MNLHILKRLSAILALIFTAGCSDVLDISPRTSVSPDNLGQNEVEQLLNGVYKQFQNGPGRDNVFLFDLLGGNLLTSNLGGRNEFIEHDVDADNGALRTMWYGYYRGIYRVNILIETLERLEPTPRNQEILGIAHFFRGYAYYSLVTRFGGVPILRTETRDFVERNTEAEVWAFVREELEKAIDLAPDFSSKSDPYYATSDAAKALLARTALTLGDMATATQLSEELIESGDFGLEDDFASIFRSGSDSETIFAFENRFDEGVTFGALFTTVNYPTGGSYFFVPVDEMYDLFDDEDLRKEVTVSSYSALPMVNKYQGGLQGGDPIIIARIAEMYLISAEAQGLAGLDRLNELRVMRGLDPLAIADEALYAEAVAEERRRELAYEGFRWYDLVRTGKAMDELPTVTAEYQLRLPIPVSELDLNPLLEQNPGY
ncbi:MAG TPA: RagB/SusD family nutrient uptake outer membrane protein [Cyclobacteriaceae bacterium]|jgi:hypothetical protein